jgi:diaminohydroxyphosphoribosylaminopyrimidine deaminase/5-amino-6-(5-phosphoribosylamino)uracil reductase
MNVLNYILTSKPVIITVPQLKLPKQDFDMNNIPLLTEKISQNLKKSLERHIHNKYRESELPFVTVKFAQTLDGKIATLTGDSKWISSPSSLRLAHTLRSCHDAVLVGVNTIIRDDPLLTVRLVKGTNPQKVILDSQLRTPPDSKILKGRSAPSTIIATTSPASKRKVERLKDTGASVWVIKKDGSGQVELKYLLEKLRKEGIRSLLVEGGTRVITNFLNECLADHLLIVIAPKILGKGVGAIDHTVISGFTDSFSLPSVKYFTTGKDIILQVFL